MNDVIPDSTMPILKEAIDKIVALVGTHEARNMIDNVRKELWDAHLASLPPPARKCAHCYKNERDHIGFPVDAPDDARVGDTVTLYCEGGGDATFEVLALRTGMIEAPPQSEIDARRKLTRERCVRLVNDMRLVQEAGGFVSDEYGFVPEHMQTVMSAVSDDEALASFAITFAGGWNNRYGIQIIKDSQVIK